jgi:LDH2 family malate/lactate/ureidoglycolate dehydrogenase
MKININSLKNLLTDILIKKGFSNKDALFIANDYWNAEISGKRTHGIIKFYKELAFINDKEATPRVIKDKGPIVLIDANKEVGPLAAKKAIDLLIKRARKYGVAIVGMKNSQRYGSLSSWSLRIAEADLIGIVINSCEPAAAPYRGISPILGTNPLSVSIPMPNNPIILDMATSKSSMSELLLSVYNNKPLKRATFLDKNGKYTTNPRKVNAVESFGGYKGYGLGLILQILSGSLVTAKMGFNIKNHYDFGYYFQAIDPTILQNLETFKSQNEIFIKEIRSGKKKVGAKEILIPGERSMKTKEKALKNENIIISEKIFSQLNRELNHEKK